ncbi:MAG: hypothetical protein ABI557_02285 [Aureliella sp.]
MYDENDYEEFGETKWMAPEDISADLLQATSFSQAAEYCFEHDDAINDVMQRLEDAVEAHLGRKVLGIDGEWSRA